MKSRTRKADRTVPHEMDEEVYIYKQETKCTRALKSAFLRQVTPVPCFSVCVSPRNMGMPWAYVSKGPADTVRNSALIDEIFRKAGMKPRATVTPAPEPYGKLLSKL